MTKKEIDDSGAKESFLGVHEELLRMLNEKKKYPEDFSETIAPFEMEMEAETPEAEVEEVSAVKEEPDTEAIMEPVLMESPEDFSETIAPFEMELEAETPEAEVEEVSAVKEEPDTEEIAEPVVVPMAVPEPVKPVDKPLEEPVNEPQFRLKKVHLLVAAALVGVCAIFYLNQSSKSKHHEPDLASTNVESPQGSADEGASMPFDPSVLQPMPVREKSDELEKGLCAHWTFDETERGVLVDSSGSGRNGTLLHGLSFAESAVPGVTASALRFDGLDDGIEFPSVPVTTAITVSAWAKISRRPFRDHLISNHPSWFLSANSGTIRFAVQVEENGTGKTEGSAIFSSVDALGSDWHHYVGVYDGTAVYAYLDGSLSYEEPLSGNLVKGAGSRIGRYWLGSRTDYQWEGEIDEVRIYDRALNADEVAELNLRILEAE